MISKKQWMIGFPLAAAAAFISMSHAEPARAQAFAGDLGAEVQVGGESAAPMDCMAQVAAAVGGAARAELARQSRKPNPKRVTTDSVAKASARLFN